VSESEKSAGDAVSDETAVPLETPTSTTNQQIEQFRGAVGPEHIGGVRQADALSDVTTADEVAGVLSHPRESVLIQFGVEGGSCRIGVGGIAQQEQDRRHSGGDFGGEPSPALDDAARIRLACLERVGPNFGRYRALTLERATTQGAHQPRLAAIRLVDRCRGNARVACDRLDSCGRVTLLVEAMQRGIEQGTVGLA